MCFDEHVGVLRLGEGSGERFVGMLSVKLYEGRLYKASRNRCPMDPSRGWGRVKVSVDPVSGAVRVVSELSDELVQHYVKVFEHWKAGRVWRISGVSEVVVEEAYADTAEEALDAYFRRVEVLTG